jgi:hypothetical protein
MVDLQKSNSPPKAIWQWWLGLTGSRSSLGYCGEEVIERIANDVGVSASELCALAKRGPQSADLLLRRMEALDLEQNEVAQVERATFQDLQRACSLCDRKRRCACDLARKPFDPSWKDYCPNAQTLTVLSALPWAARQEW